MSLITKLSVMGAGVLTKLPTPVAGVIGKASLAITAHSPVILAVGGGLLAVGAVVEAARKTPKFVKELEKYNKTLEDQKMLKEKIDSGEYVPDEPYTDEDYKQERMSIYAEIVVKGIKTYGKAACMLLGSFACYGFALKILNGWFAGAAAAAAATREELEHLESNVEREYGTEVLERLKGPNQDEIVVESHIDENGQTVTDKVKTPNHKAFSFLFDEASNSWSKNRLQNKNFIEGVEKQFNRILDARRYVFLNEVLEVLELPLVKEGFTWGWIKNPNDPNTANNYISFGINDLRRRETDPALQAFIHGDERSVWLEMNCEQIIDALGFVGIRDAA